MGNRKNKIEKEIKKPLYKLKAEFQKGGYLAYDTTTGDLFTNSKDLQKHLRHMFSATFPSFKLSDPNMEDGSSDRRYMLTIRHPKVVTLCPYRGFPDVTTLTIYIDPRKKILELAAFAKFLELFTTIGITHESLAVAIDTFIDEEIDPHYVRTIAEFKGFAGMDIEVDTCYPKNRNVKLGT